MSVAVVKNALITTATVLVVIAVLNQIPPARPIVQKALNG